MSTSDDSIDVKEALKKARASESYDKRRRIQDKVVNGLIAFGGIFVIVAITAIFFYLLSVALPLFTNDNAKKVTSYETSLVSSNVLPIVLLDDNNVIGSRLYGSGEIEFFQVQTGKVFEKMQLAPNSPNIVSLKRGSITDGTIGIGYQDGSLLVIRPKMQVRGLGKDRVLDVGIEYPFGNQRLSIGNFPLTEFDILNQGGELLVMAAHQGQISLSQFREPGSGGGGLSLAGSAFGTQQGNADGVYSLASESYQSIQNKDINDVQLGQGGRWGYVFSNDGNVTVLRNVDGKFQPFSRTKVAEAGGITASTMLQGDISLIVGDKNGRVSQWFMARSKKDGQDVFALEKVRDFKLQDAPISSLTGELRRKGIVAGDTKGNIGYFYTTSESTIEKISTELGQIASAFVSSHGDGLLVIGTKGSGFWTMDAHHPEVSLSSIWGKVWYESYNDPQYVWQSTSGNIDFESKLSLVPLTFGTLKAAFWAMVLSAPLAIAAAMYTAVFMNARLRTKVKPALELMEALPTVILGFLAGLWLAPIVTDYLPSIFSLIIVIPLIIMLTGFLWMQLPLEKRNSLPDGIAPALLILPILIGSIIAFIGTDWIEQTVFASHQGSMVVYMRNELGVDYQNQNALIVGIMMGFAVIPTIFSIAEDALFAVPQHIKNGSLALGATPWQTMVRVILPTASPGIFSAVMIGFGRAVGETMIVLMATGNTPIMDLSLFNGMRTLSANVAVEMGEAEVGSTHYRVLFLSALVLFILTFILNTVAEVVRSSLRKKYGSL